MSALKSQIQEDVKAAMKARDQHTLTTLRCLLSEFKYVEIEAKSEADDGKLLGVIQKEIKKRRDALQYAENAKREELIEQNKKEIAILQKYLGEQLSEDKLKEIISGLIASGHDSLGKIMGALNKDYKGKFEGKVASDLARSLLG